MKNLTPHPVHLRLGDGSTTTLPTSGEVLRLAETDREDGTTQTGAQLIRRSYRIPGLPAYPAVVSLPVLMALATNGHYPENLYAPDTGPTCIRDDSGQIVAVRRLLRLEPDPQDQLDRERALKPGARFLEIPFGSGTSGDNAHLAKLECIGGEWYPEYPCTGNYGCPVSADQVKRIVNETIDHCDMPHDTEDQFRRSRRYGVGIPRQERLARLVADRIGLLYNQEVWVCSEDNHCNPLLPHYNSLWVLDLVPGSDS